MIINVSHTHSLYLLFTEESHANEVLFMQRGATKKIADLDWPRKISLPDHKKKATM